MHGDTVWNSLLISVIKIANSSYEEMMVYFMLAGCLSVKVVSKETKGDFDLYRLSLESIEEQESDTVLLYHFQEWPRHAVPNSGLRGICNMYQEVMRSKVNQQPTINTVRC